MSSTPELSSSAAADPAFDPRPDGHAEDVALPDWLVGSRAFGVIVVDEAAEIVFANDAISSALGFESGDAMTGQNLRASLLQSESDWRDWERGGEQQYRLRNASGAPVSFHGEGIQSIRNLQRPLRYVVLSLQGSSNETGRLLEHAARMEAVAGLSSGIAHDFNNLLTVLVGNLYLLGEELRDNESAFGRIRSARDTALRGAELTRQLLNYARDDEAEDAEVRPASVVLKLQPLLEKLVGSSIELTVDLAAESHTVPRVERSSRARSSIWSSTPAMRSKVTAVSASLSTSSKIKFVRASSSSACPTMARVCPRK
jgi:signal transduction histidine kinase